MVSWEMSHQNRALSQPPRVHSGQRRGLDSCHDFSVTRGKRGGWKTWDVGRVFIFLPGSPRPRPVLGENSYNFGFCVCVAVAVAPWTLEAGAQIGLQPECTRPLDPRFLFNRPLPGPLLFILFYFFLKTLMCFPHPVMLHV